MVGKIWARYTDNTLPGRTGERKGWYCADVLTVPCTLLPPYTRPNIQA